MVRFLSNIGRWPPIAVGVNHQGIPTALERFRGALPWNLPDFGSPLVERLCLDARRLSENKKTVRK